MATRGMDVQGDVLTLVFIGALTASAQASAANAEVRERENGRARKSLRPAEAQFMISSLQLPAYVDLLDDKINV
jgi:hypothetical protein